MSPSPLPPPSGNVVANQPIGIPEDWDLVVIEQGQSSVFVCIDRSGATVTFQPYTTNAQPRYARFDGRTFASVMTSLVGLPFFFLRHDAAAPSAG